MTNRPRVSIVTPFLDAELFLHAAVESVLGQTLDDWELLLVDDGSTDESTAIAKRFAAATLEGLIMVNADEILYCESDSAYCKLIFIDGKSLFLSRTLKDVEEALLSDNFCRIHHSYLINLNYVQKYIKGEGGEVVMNNGASLPVSRTRKQDFLKLLEKI